MTKVVFDENRLTIGDLEDFEDAVGAPLFEALKPSKVYDENGKVERDEDGRPKEEMNLSAKVLKAIVWIANRQENPEFTLADARNVRVTELDIIEADDDEEAADPKD